MKTVFSIIFRLLRLILWTTDDSMGKVKLSGPGYDAEPNYDVEKLQGLNAGYLKYVKL